jgi:hypothetical protein
MLGTHSPAAPVKQEFPLPAGADASTPTRNRSSCTVGRRRQRDPLTLRLIGTRIFVLSAQVSLDGGKVALTGRVFPATSRGSPGPRPGHRFGTGPVAVGAGIERRQVSTAAEALDAPTLGRSLLFPPSAGKHPKPVFYRMERLNTACYNCIQVNDWRQAMLRRSAASVRTTRSRCPAEGLAWNKRAPPSYPQASIGAAARGSAGPWPAVHISS